MRSVFVRKRKELLATPAWMGGLNYDDVGLDDIPSLRPPSQKSTKESRGSGLKESRGSGRSSDIASGMQTRVATNLPWNAIFQSPVSPVSPEDADISGRPSSDVMRGHHPHPPPHGLSRRPNTAGHRPTIKLMVDETKVPPRRALSARASRRQDVKSPWNLSNQHGAGAQRPPTARSEQRSAPTLPGVYVPPKQQQLYYTLYARILGVRGHDRAQDHHQADAEATFNAVVSLSIEGSTYVSKPIKMARHQSISVPEDTFVFQLQGGIYGSLLNVKLLRKYGEVAKDQSPEIGTAFVDLASVQKSGGTQVVNCKLTSELSSKVAPEVHLELRLITKTVDFNFSYKGEQPIFKKSGYTITPDGITSFPLPYRKKGLPPGCTLKSLQIQEVVSEEAGVVVYRAMREADKTWYTIKRFSIMHMDPRTQLISELNGLLDCPPQLSIPPLDAFLDRLDVVLVLDELQGRYLRTIIQKKGKMPDQNISIVLRQLLQVLRYLHENKLRVHNDVEASNILVLKQGEVRLGGFCYSAKHVGKARKFAGPYVHMSPERLLGLDCGFPADVWSLGILALELTLGRLPYDMSKFKGENALFEFKQQVVTEPSPHLRRGEEHSDDLRHFVDSCLHKNLKLRLSVNALVTHPFVTKYESAQNNQLGRWVLNKKKEMDMALAKPPPEPEAPAEGPARTSSSGSPQKGEGKGKEGAKEARPNAKEAGGKEGKATSEAEGGASGRRGSVSGEALARAKG